MHNCPPSGKWSIAVWEGQSGTAASDALATCGVGAVAAAYSLDSQTGAWWRWFAGKPEVSNLPPLNSLQGVLALGSADSGATPTPAVTATPTRTPTATPTPTPTPTPSPTPTQAAQYLLSMTANPPEGGTTSPSPGTHWYADGSRVPVIAMANFGWVLDYWDGDCSGEGPETTVYMDGDKTCIANFTCGVVPPGTYVGDVSLYGEPAPDETLISAWVDGEWWSDCPTSGGRYVCDVPDYLPQEPPCFEGGQIEFFADDALCEPSPEWGPGLREVDLDCW